MQMRNKVPQKAQEQELNLTRLHRKTASLSYPTILKWAGKEAPDTIEQMDAKTLYELAQALDCEMTDLFEVAGE